jgi:hypothetical protein
MYVPGALTTVELDVESWRDLDRGDELGHDPQPAPQPRLLLDLAQRRLGLRLARVELAFGNDQSS